MKNKDKKPFHPDRITSYFYIERKVLFLVAFSGIIYNLGLMATPWFEGRLAECLADILTNQKTFNAMFYLALGYILTVCFVQDMRYLKRFYVRRFANNINRRMKQILYHNLLRKNKMELKQEGIGDVMTKAISDVDDCAEGMRKFTTELFDTGVALLGYSVMLIHYDWQLALICLLFPLISYYLAEKMKKLVQRTNAEYKVQNGVLNVDTMDRVTNTITYRIFGCEKQSINRYEDSLKKYEQAAVKADIWTAAFPPLYKIISLIGVVPILYFGAQNVLGHGHVNWSIAVFTTFLACYLKLATKSSKAAKLFNSVHRAQISWERIQPFMKETSNSMAETELKSEKLHIEDLGFSYYPGTPIFENLSLDAVPGQIIGITGPVACGKSTLGKTFLNEYPYCGSIKFGNKELSELYQQGIRPVGYLGHNPELLNDTIENNVLMGNKEGVMPWLKTVCLDQEICEMSEGIHTVVGDNGIKLSGGQAQRLALARTLCHKKPIIVLDDPFSALDRDTERRIFDNIRNMTQDSIVFLISHRLYLFPEMDQVIWLENKKTVVGTHESLMQNVLSYQVLFEKGGRLDEKEK